MWKLENRRPAKKRRGIDTRNTIYSSKRIIGRRFSDPETQEFRERHAFELVALPGGAETLPLVPRPAGPRASDAVPPKRGMRMAVAAAVCLHRFSTGARV